MPTDVRLRPAEELDVGSIARLFTETRSAAVPAMPPAIHSAADNEVFFAALLTSGHGAVWVAEDSAGRIVGFAVIQDNWLHSLYVHPDRARAGIGSALLDLVKSLLPSGFCLWVFESNTPARLFYEQRGLLELERTDGSGNEENAPDLKMAWPGAEPLAFLRGLIDDLDDQVADLLHRRTALTGAVQRVKAGGPDSLAGRDPDRELGIARRMAAKAPVLGEDRLRRIVDTIITESLGANSES